MCATIDTKSSCLRLFDGGSPIGGSCTMHQNVPLRLDLPFGLAPFRFPQGLLCLGPLDPPMGHALEVLPLHLHRRHLWRGLPPAPSDTITQSSADTLNVGCKLTPMRSVTEASKPIDMHVCVSQVCMLLQSKNKIECEVPSRLLYRAPPHRYAAVCGSRSPHPNLLGLPPM